MFGDVDFDPSYSYASVPLEEQLSALGQAVAAGKIRAVGLSNETTWGLTTCLHAGTQEGVKGPLDFSCWRATELSAGHVGDV